MSPISSRGASFLWISSRWLVFRELAGKIEKTGIKILSNEEWRKTLGKPVLNHTIQAAKLEKQNYQYTVTIEVTKSEADNSAPGSEKSKTIWSIYEMGEGDVSGTRPITLCQGVR